MTKRKPTSGAQRKPTNDRGETRGTLRAAVDAAVRREIAERMGRAITQHDVNAMVSFVGSSDLHRRMQYGVATVGAVRLRELVDFLEDDPPAPFAELSSLASAPPVRAFLEALKPYERLAKQAHKRSPRTLLADAIRFRGPLFWWKADPTLRDRALLSLLAGSFPEPTKGEVLTVEDVIQRESDAIGAAMRRKRQRQPT